MGGIITFILTALIIGYGIFAIITGIKKEANGEGCSGCSGCCYSDNCYSHDK